jgi:hypothetical protein
VTEKSERRDASIADLVDDEAEEENAEREWPKPDAQNVALLRLIEVELRLPLTDDLGANDEAEGTGDKRDEAAPKEASGVDGVGVHGGTWRVRTPAVCARRPHLASADRATDAIV